MFAFVGLISLGESCVWGRICIQGWVVNRRSLHSAPDGAPVETTNLRFSLMVVIGKVNSRSLHCAPHARRSGRDDTSLVEPQGRPQRCHPDRSDAHAARSGGTCCSLAQSLIWTRLIFSRPFGTSRAQLINMASGSGCSPWLFMEPSSSRL